MNLFDIPGLWQMYTFCIVVLLGSLFMCGLFMDPCLLFTGKSVCNPGAEAYSSRIIAIGLLYVGIFFLALTYINQTSRPKLKQLANMGMTSTIALIVSIIFIGPRSLGGEENSILHMLDMLTAFILLAIMVSATYDNSEMITSNSPFAGLGVNPKTFLLSISILVFMKLFVLSEFVNISVFLSDSDSMTSLSSVMWRFVIVIIFLILFPIIFALIYGDEKDQEILTGLTVLMMIVSIISILPMRHFLQGVILTMSYISLGVVTLWAVIAIYAGRLTRRHEYEPISEVTIDA